MKKLLPLFLSILFCSPAWATNWCADAGLEAGYYMDEASGNLDDCSSNDNAMVATGDPGTWNSTGQIAGAFDFAQTNNTGFSSTDIAAMRNMVTISAGAWTAPDTDGDNNSSFCDAGWIIGKAGTDGWGLCLDNDAAPSEFQFFVFWSGGRVNEFTTTDPVNFDPSWQHIAVTYDGSSTSNDAVMYYNGVVQSNSGMAPSGSLDDDTDDEPTIGIAGDGSGVGSINEYDGDIDEVFVYDGGAVLTSTQINDIMDNGLTAVAGRRRVMLI